MLECLGHNFAACPDANFQFTAGLCTGKMAITI